MQFGRFEIADRGGLACLAETWACDSGLGISRFRLGVWTRGSDSGMGLAQARTRARAQARSRARALQVKI